MTCKAALTLLVLVSVAFSLLPSREAKSLAEPQSLGTNVLDAIDNYLSTYNKTRNARHTEKAEVKVGVKIGSDSEESSESVSVEKDSREANGKVKRDEIDLDDVAD